MDTNNTEMPVIKVLYIDDEAHNLISFKANFRRHFQIQTAESAAEARILLDEQQETDPFSVIVSDQRMPGMTGIEFFASILPIYPEPLRILLTGYSDLSAVIDAINVGQVYRYLQKPWNEVEVISTVNSAFEVFDLRRKNIELTEKLIDMNKKLEFLARQALLS
jgi:response regulator RpfG family c-di-GMP phosphodiesterase